MENVTSPSCIYCDVKYRMHKITANESVVEVKDSYLLLQKKGEVALTFSVLTEWI